jgi:hypothetical protein
VSSWFRKKRFEKEVQGRPAGEVTMERRRSAQDVPFSKAALQSFPNGRTARGPGVPFSMWDGFDALSLADKQVRDLD